MGLASADAAGGVIHHARCAIAIAARAPRAGDRLRLPRRPRPGGDARRRGPRAAARLRRKALHPSAAGGDRPRRVRADRREIAAGAPIDAAWREAAREGRGVFALDGAMVDAPVVAAAQQVLDRARRAGVLAEDELRRAARRRARCSEEDGR
jgi:citrate lyase subunit beta/citryl-CoA lyase